MCTWRFDQHHTKIIPERKGICSVHWYALWAFVRQSFIWFKSPWSRGTLWDIKANGRWHCHWYIIHSYMVSPHVVAWFASFHDGQFSSTIKFNFIHIFSNDQTVSNQISHWLLRPVFCWWNTLFSVFWSWISAWSLVPRKLLCIFVYIVQISFRSVTKHQWKWSCAAWHLFVDGQTQPLQLTQFSVGSFLMKRHAESPTLWSDVKVSK